MKNLRIRLANDTDVTELYGLAALDSQAWEGGDALVAEVDTRPASPEGTGGEIWAALPLDGGPPVADPFRRTSDLVSLLELRREQLARAAQRRAQPAGRRLLRSLVRA